MRSGYFFKTAKTAQGTFMIDINPPFLEYTYPCTASLELVLARMYQMYLYDFLKFMKTNYNAAIKENKHLEHLHRYYITFNTEEECDNFILDANIRCYEWITGSPSLAN